MRGGARSRCFRWWGHWSARAPVSITCTTMLLLCRGSGEKRRKSSRNVSVVISRDGLGRAWVAYAATGLVLSGVCGGVISLVLAGAEERAMWIAALIAYGVQVVAFAGILFARGQPNLFLVSWLSGMVLRFGVIGVLAWWLAGNEALPREVALLSLVGFVFLLLLLEPVFLRDARKS